MAPPAAGGSTNSRLMPSAMPAGPGSNSGSAHPQSGRPGCSAAYSGQLLQQHMHAPPRQQQPQHSAQSAACLSSCAQHASRAATHATAGAAQQPWHGPSQQHAPSREGSSTMQQQRSGNTGGRSILANNCLLVQQPGAQGNQPDADRWPPGTGSFHQGAASSGSMHESLRSAMSGRKGCPGGAAQRRTELPSNGQQDPGGNRAANDVAAALDGLDDDFMPLATTRAGRT
jgi:hypothetical protein